MAITIQITGHKNSGKTLLTTALIKKLTVAHFHVAAIKHDAHQGSMDVPGTDTAKMTLAGAQKVVLQSPNGLFFHQQGTGVSLDSLVSFLSADNDFILIEGHKKAAYPKIVLLTDGESASSISNQAVIRSARIIKAGRVDQAALTRLVNWTTAYLYHHHEMEE